MSISSMTEPSEPDTTEAEPFLEEAADDSATPAEDSSPPATPAPAAAPKDDFLEALLNKITPVSKVKKNLKVLIYSDPGAGKSVFLGTAPNNFIVDVEDGLISLNNHPELVKDSVQTYRYKTFNGFEAVTRKFLEKPDELAHFDTFSVDSVSELHKRGLQEVTERDYANNPLEFNRYVAVTEQHSENNEHIRRLVSSLRDLDMNLILTAHARTIEPKNSWPKTFPDFSEKLANVLAGIVDIVGYMQVKEVEGELVRVLRLQGTQSIVAKTRIGGYPAEIINPTWDTLYDTFMEAQRKVAAGEA